MMHLILRVPDTFMMKRVRKILEICQRMFSKFNKNRDDLKSIRNTLVVKLLNSSSKNGARGDSKRP